MDPVSASITIDRPPEEVFEYLLDMANHQEFSDHYLVDWHLTRADSYGRGASETLIGRILGPRRRDVEMARDVGNTDVLTRPVSAKTIMRELHLAVAEPRPFIAASDFFGPDRCTGARSHFRGSDRRKRQPRKVKVAAPGLREPA